MSRIRFEWKEEFVACERGGLDKIRVVRRGLCNFAAALSLLLCLVTVVLWVRSYNGSISHRSNDFQAEASTIFARIWWVHAYDGHATFEFKTAKFAHNSFAVSQFTTYVFVRRLRGLPIYIDFAPPRRWYEFDVGIGSKTDAVENATYRWVHLEFPLWFPTIAFAILPLIALKKFFPRARRPHVCRQCFYDLTGNTSGTCPECGTVVDGKV